MPTGPDRTRPPIAVVGVSALFPGSVGKTGFWKDILAGTDLLTDVPPTHWLIDDHYDPDMNAPDKTYGRRGGFLSDIDLDAMGFGIPPNTVPATDTAQLLALIVAQRVLDDATRGNFSDEERAKTSVILGVTSGQELLGAMASRMNRPMWLEGMRRAGVPEDEAQAACQKIADLHPAWIESTFPGLLGNVVAGRIANRLDLGGTNCVTDAACASSFSAISMGINELYLGDSDLVISGGVDTMNDIFMYMCFSKTPALSRSEDIRPFSDQADGTMLGEGIGMVALKRLADAERDGNPIYCVINGVGSSSDGRSKSVYAPVSSGQARALDDAYAKSGYGPDTVELIEAHGTGTVAGDAAEFGGLKIAFDGTGREDRQWCALGSVKSQVGHTKAAAGAAGLFKVVMALHHKVLPQTAKINKPNPELDLENSPFHLNTRTRPWIRSSDHERRASVSSFGFGGSNFHVALSEYVGDGTRAERLRSNDVELVTLCGAPDDVVQQAAQHADGATVPGYLLWLAQSSQRNFSATAPARLALIAADEADLVDNLRQAVERIKSDPSTGFSTPKGMHYGVGSTDSSVAYVFPGQGSQYLHMGADLAMEYRDAMVPWEVAADLDWDDQPLQDVVFPITSFTEGAEDAQLSLLTATQWVQPAIGTMSLGLLRLLRSIGIEPAAVGGHSFGEVTALHAAGVLSEHDMICVARRRGELMAEAAQTPGSMTAVAESVDKVRALVENSGIDVVVANHNSPTQVVLSGATSAIEAIEQKLSDAGITAKRLPVATAFHSPVVSGASGAFSEYLTSVEFGSAALPVFANETAEPYSGEVAEMRAQLGRQLANPVRFVEMIEGMYDAGARIFVEVGPGSTLTGLIAKILKGRDHTAVTLDKKGKPGQAAFLGGLAELAAAGVAMNLAALWSEYGEYVNPHDVVKPKLVIPINGSNYAKPYPPADLNDLAAPNPTRAATPAPTNAVAASPAVVSHATTASVPSTPSADVLAAYQAVQQQTAQAHSSYVTAMAQAHSAYLAAAQQGLAVLGGVSVNPGPSPLASAVPSVGLGSPVFDVPAATFTPPVAPAPATAPAPEIAPAAPAASTDAGSVDLMGLLLVTVADKTGYPSDMLSMEMELEADLGIDSIKRVEILSAMQEAVPSLPEVDTSVMAELVTLGQIVEYMEGRLAEVGGIVATGGPTSAATPAASTDAGSVDLMGLLLVTVADKTGYPSDMLSMEMELEADLGIDSIKRVEILSAMQEAVPSLPEVDTSVMAELVTLGQIVEYMDGRLTAVTGSPIATTGSTSTNGSATNGSTSNGSTPVAPLGRFVLEVIEREAPGTILPGLGDAPIAVIDRASGLGAEVAQRLTSAGFAAQVVSDPSASVAPSTSVVYLGGLRDFVDTDDALAVHREAFIAAREFAGTRPTGGVFVVVSDIGGTFGCEGVASGRAWSGGLAGLTRTAALEWPEVSTKVIDLDRASRSVAELAESIVAELTHGGSDAEVGLGSDGRRVVLRSAPVEVTAGEMHLGADDVIVVSGGGRGVTAATVIELARATGATFVLLGRTPLGQEPEICWNAIDDAQLKRVLLDAATAEGRQVSPIDLGREVSAILANREIRHALQSIAQAGGTAEYRAVDITDGAALGDALVEVRQTHGPITGVIHGAGVLADKLIAEKSDEQFNRVFDAKVGGLRALLASTSDDPLRLLVFFSSVAARTGNTGQVDYAMANEILNKVAASERTIRGESCVVKSLGWGPWEGGMVSPSLKAHFASLGVTLIPLAEGAAMFVDEIASPQTDEVELVLGGGVLPDLIDVVQRTPA